MTETIYAYVEQLLGSPPAGYEPLLYIFSGAILVLLCFSAVAMISGIFKWIGGI